MCICWALQQFLEPWNQICSYVDFCIILGFHHAATENRTWQRYNMQRNLMLALWYLPQANSFPGIWQVCLPLKSATAPHEFAVVPWGASCYSGYVVLGITLIDFRRQNVGMVYQELDFGHVHKMVPAAILFTRSPLQWLLFIRKEKSVSFFLLGNSVQPTPDQPAWMPHQVLPTVGVK